MTGALIVPDPDAATPTLVDGSAGVEFAFGGGPDVQSRMAGAGSVDKAIAAARRHHKALEKYGKDFAEYERKLAEWKKQQAGAESDQGSAKPKHEPGQKESATGSDLPPDFREWPARKRMEFLRKRREGASGAGDEAKAAGSKAAAGSDRPKAPRPVTPDPGSESLLRILQGKVPLRVEAHWKQDILAAIEAARKARVPLVIVGGTEARQVIEELKKARVRVILGAPAPFGSQAPDRGLPEPGLARALADAQIPFGFMTAGQDDFGADDLPLVAALHVGAGLGEAQAFTALTLGAAQVLGRDATLGTLEPGRAALIQVVSGEPLDPGSRVHAMVLGTKVVMP
jgi:imidazolonepropionase-like amidohydrolase